MFSFRQRVDKLGQPVWIKQNSLTLDAIPAPFSGGNIKPVGRGKRVSLDLYP